MCAAKTRFGFAGDGSEPPDGNEARSARTILGHDIHLPGKSAQPPVSPPAREPAPRLVQDASRQPRGPDDAARGLVQTPASDEETAELPSRRPRRGDSRRARFLGHWSKSGRFISQHPGASDDDLRIPRDTLGRNLLLVVAVALLTFLLTLALVKLRQRLAQVAVPHPETAALALADSLRPENAEHHTRCRQP